MPICTDTVQFRVQFQPIVQRGDLRSTADHAVALLHDLPDLPADSAVRDSHDDCRHYEDQQQHVELVQLQQRAVVKVQGAVEQTVT